MKTLEEYCASVDAVYRRRISAKLLAGSALLTGKPFSVPSFYSKELERKIAYRLRSEKIDRILVFCSAMAEYVLNGSNIPRVMDFVDVDSAKWLVYADYHRFPLSWIYRSEASRLARYEERVARAFVHSVLTTEAEADLLRHKVNDRPITAIPNGVDLTFFTRTGVDPSPSAPPTVVFTGAMDYFPNVDAVSYFCREILPLIRRVLPQVHFYIVGRNPTRAVTALGLDSHVTVTGTVPDVRPYLVRAAVAVAPFRIARGIQNKILEAMAMGVPVVGTTTAFQGIHRGQVTGAQVADDPEDFAHGVLAFLRDPEWRHFCSVQARQYVERYHRWEEHGARLESLLQDPAGQIAPIPPRAGNATTASANLAR